MVSVVIINKWTSGSFTGKKKEQKLANLFLGERNNPLWGSGIREEAAK